MAQLFKNNATSYIDGAISSTATSINLSSGTGAKFPTITGSDYFLATIVGLNSGGVEDTWEIVKVTGRSSDTLTVVRAQESTTALSWAHASRIENRLTAASTNDFTSGGSTLQVDSGNNRVGILNASPDVSLDAGSATDALHVPSGTTAQRPGSPTAGYFRYNSTTGGFEGYTDAWGEVGGGGVNLITDNFTGNGSTGFTLSQDPSVEQNTFVYIDGVYQFKNTYSTSGTTLTFSTAPPTGASIEVMSMTATNSVVGTVSDNAITTAKIADGAVTSAKLAAGAGGVTVASSAPSVGAEGSLYYNSTTNLLYASDGSAWQTVGNFAPSPTGGTVTIATQVGGSSFTYDLGLNFQDADTIDTALTYTLNSGSLPAGASLPSAGNSALTGTATNPGGSTTYNFVIKATDDQGAFATQAYTQTITPQFVATGGTVTDSGGYRIHTFNSSGNFVVPAGPTITTARYLVIAGGGGGGDGYYGGGGGAGGYRTNFGTTGGGGSTEGSVTLSASTTYAITVGAGGAGMATGSQGHSNLAGNGSDSVIGTLNITSVGGGGGSSWGSSEATRHGRDGGSGGGAGNGDPNSSHRTASDMLGGAGTTGQGYAGGHATGYAAPYPGAGGGGAGGIGIYGGANQASDAGDGGPGVASTITGSSVIRAGGGGAAANTNAGAGVGGSGGGGDGTGYPESTVGGAGTANTGSGGGGSGDLDGGGAGGAGVVIISYPYVV